MTIANDPISQLGKCIKNDWVISGRISRNRKLAVSPVNPHDSIFSLTPICVSEIELVELAYGLFFKIGLWIVF